MIKTPRSTVPLFLVLHRFRTPVSAACETRNGSLSRTILKNLRPESGIIIDARSYMLYGITLAVARMMDMKLNRRRREKKKKRNVLQVSLPHPVIAGRATSCVLNIMYIHSNYIAKKLIARIMISCNRGKRREVALSGEMSLHPAPEHDHRIAMKPQIPKD